MSLPVWLPGPMFPKGSLCLWPYVPSGGSVSGPMFLRGGGVSVQVGLPDRDPSVQRPPGQRHLKSQIFLLKMLGRRQN